MAKTNHRVNKDKEAKKPESPAHQRRRQEKRIEQKLEEIFYDEGIDADEYDEFERFERISRKR